MAVESWWWGVAWTAMLAVALAMILFRWSIHRSSALASGTHATAFKEKNGDDVSSRAASSQPPVSGKDPRNSMAASLASQDPDLVVLFGSQTGTAEDYAARLVKAGRQRGLKCRLVDLMEFDFDELTSNLNDADFKIPLLCFVLATYGEGEPTDNAQDFYDWLMGNQCPALDGLHYTIFGLGNKSYEHFNAMARRCDARLAKMGARRIGECGEADDDQGSVEDDFMKWSEETWKDICLHFGIDPTSLSMNLVRSFSFSELPSVNTRKLFRGEIGVVGAWNGGQSGSRVVYDHRNPYYATVHAWKDLFPQGLTEKTSNGSLLPRKCLHIELDITGSSVRYQTGDHVAILPENDEAEVQGLASVLGLDKCLDTAFEMRALEAGTKKYPFPCPTTYRAALSYYLDIMSLPKMHVLGALAAFAADPVEREHLQSMAMVSGKAAYHGYITEAGRNLRQVIEEHPSIVFSRAIYPSPGGSESDDSKTLSMGDLFELLPRLQPRYYSISSCPKLYPNQIHITVAVAFYLTATGRHGAGVCTSYLDRLCRAEYANKCSTSIAAEPSFSSRRVGLSVRTSHFRLPRNPKQDVWMIGPGTGIAPFRAFLQERRLYFQEKWKVYLERQQLQAVPMFRQVTDRPGMWLAMLESRRELEPSPNHVMGETTLFFGCRNRDQDFLYRNELTDLFDLKSNDASPAYSGLGDLIAAFSREQADKVYVQYLIRRDPIIRKRLYNLVIDGGSLYVCGDAKNMARDVHQMLTECLQEYGGLDADGASQLIKKVKEEGRYAEDTWS